MKLDRLTLEQLIQETLDEWTAEPRFDSPFGTREVPTATSKDKSGKGKLPYPKDAEKIFVDSVIKRQFPGGLFYKQQKILAQKLTQVIDAAIADEIGKFEPTPLAENRVK